MGWLKVLRIPYHLRMFSLLAAILVGTLVAVAVWIYHSERRLRIESIRNQIEFVNQRIINAYENDLDAEQFLQFVGHYYKAHPLFEHIRITLYYDGDIAENIGQPISTTELRKLAEHGGAPFAVEVPEMPDREFMALQLTKVSADGKLRVATVLPFDSAMLNQRFYAGVYSVLMLLAVLLIIGTYIASRRLGRNVRVLRTFAERANTDPDFDLAGEFANDELGDISRQIVHIAQERNAMVLRLEHEHQIALAAVEEKNRLKHQLANDLNHELKTPVAVIKGYVDTIVQHPDMDERSRRSFLQKIAEHTERLANIIQAQGYLNGLESGTMTLRTEAVAVKDVAMQVAADLAAAGLLEKMNFICNVPPSCTVQANRRMLNAIFTNLIKNAALHSHGTQCVLDFEGTDGRLLLFRLSDNGTGVPADTLNSLFERFYRVESGRSRQSGGSGLGLAIVKAAVEAVGGSIAVANRADGHGLQFTFSLPQATENAEILGTN